MTTEIKVPTLPESVTDATIIAWHKQPGELIQPDSNLLDLETDKVVLEVPAPTEGRLVEILKQPGEVVRSGEILGRLEATDASTQTHPAAPVSAEPKPASVVTASQPNEQAGPAARREAQARDIPLNTITGSGKSGRITRADVLQSSLQPMQAPPASLVAHPATTQQTLSTRKLEERVPMSRLRARVAERLVAAQQQAAILTTFNEINLAQVMALRARYKETFEKRHGVKLGLMSFFTKATIEALKRYPVVNATLDGNDIIYHHHYDIGIAVSTDRGLVVPIIRSAEALSFAQIEKTIAEYGQKARAGQISIEDLSGGTFTITNGGVFGSLLSAPILNPPQSGILGMHKIEERPIVENGQILIRPMMYVALSYDHRLIDGKESVSFLVTLKNLLEDPAKLLLDI